MSDLLKRFANLPPERRELVLKKLRQQGAISTTGKEGQAPPIVPVARDRDLPLSFAQQRLWFFDQLEPGSPAYNIPGAVRLSGHLDTQALEQSLNEVIHRHQVLRTTFTTVNDQPVQSIAPALTIALPVTDLRSFPESERDAQVRQLTREEAQRPFDLKLGPLVRALLLRLDDKEHILLMTMHHIVSDGWSMGIFVREITTLYQAYSQSKPSPLPDLPVQYADFAVWQRDWMQGDVLQAQLDYWRQHLDSSQSLPDLPSDRPRPPVQTFEGAIHSLTLPKPLCQALQAFSQQAGGTLFITLLAAFSVLLRQYTGQTDLVIGTPIANRNRAEIEGLIGFFVNMLALRIDLSGNPTFQEMFDRVHRVVSGAQAHQDLPFERVVEELQPERDPSRTPLFQIFFNMLTLGATVIELPGLRAEFLDSSDVGSKFDWTLYIRNPDGHVQFDLLYNADLFEQATIVWLLEHYQTLLQNVVVEPEQRISALPDLIDAARARLTKQDNLVRPTNSFVKFEKEEVEQSIPDRFAKQVQMYPGNLAVKTEDYVLTYKELDATSQQVARAILAQCGPGKGQVALLFEQNAPLIVAILGTLKAGKTYVPLAPSYPKDRTLYMLQDSQADTILTNDANLAFAQDLCQAGCRVVNLDEIDSIPIDDGSLPPVSPDTIAYILYTSGSSGEPKGTVQTHRNVLHFIMNYTNGLHICAKDRLSLLYSCSFSAAVMDTMAALLNGATLYPYDTLQRGVAGLGDWLNRHEITVYHSVPTVFRHFIASLPSGIEFPWLRIIDFGGESVSRMDVEMFKEHFAPDCILVNGLGATELNVIRQFYMDKKTEIADSNVPVGYAVEDTDILLLDDEGHPVGFNREGEIVIKSQYLSLGYWHKPDLTRQAFRPDPDGSDKRLYHTGDLGRMRLDGCLEHLGRKDLQVKIRGHRIEVAEIEVALLECDSVREVVVIARDDDSDAASAPLKQEKRLVAYLVAEEGYEPQIGELYAFLEDRLPNYMIPAAFVILENLPLLPNGKVNRRALPAPEWDKPESEQDFVEPHTPTQEILADIWTQVLGIERVGIHDNFFQLGGHSLLATQVISRVHDVFPIKLSLRSLFEQPTVAGMAASIETARRADQVLRAPIVVSPAQEDEKPLSFGQQRLWFLDQWEPGNPAYNISAVVRLTGQLNVMVMEHSLNEIVRRHETLRAVFGARQGRPIQVIVPSLTLTLPVIDLGEVPENKREALTGRLITEQARYSFDLARGPLLRVALLKTADDAHVLILTMHHIISDGWSTGVLVREITTLYEAFLSGQPSPLPGLPIQYTDFAAWQQQWLQGEVLEQQLAYWQQQLGDTHPLLELPTDRPRPPTPTGRGAQQTMALSPDLSQRLKTFSQRQGVTLFVTLLAAFKTLLYRYTGQETITVGAPIANRNRSEIEGLIGFFVNTLALRSSLTGNPSFQELLARVQEVTLGAYAHQDLPFEMLVKELQLERNTSHSPLFQVMLVLQNAPMPDLALPELTLSPLNVDSGTARFDLSLIVVDTEQGLRGTLQYNTDLFEAETIARMTSHFETLLASIVANPGQRISSLPLLTDTERHQMMVAWNATQTEPPVVSCIHKLFESQAQQTPDAIATVFHAADADSSEPQHLTYRELNRRANQLAHHLRDLGIGPEVPVGVFMQRSVEMIVGLLAILKAGGAYLPLDPDYPSERVAFVLADAAAPIVLSQQELLSRLPEHRAQVLCLDTDWRAIASAEEDNPLSAVAPENLAYVIYTSGSTGQPKGVAIAHSSAVAMLAWAARVFSPEDLRSVLASTSICFDLSVYELFLPLSQGGTIVLAENALHLLTLPARETVTLINTVPSAMTELVRADDGLPRSVRTVNLAGEPLKRVLVHQVYEHSQAQRIYNLYGPSEDTTYSTFVMVARDDPREPSIGRPVDNTQAYILDPYMQPVPIGVVGELYLGGAGLSRGYLNRPERTAVQYLPNPFSHEPGARLYRTGDLCRYRPDGNLEFLGRLDHQVKVRGFRIELGEIEATLAQHPNVCQAIVVARDGDLPPATSRLVAYLVAKDGQAPASSELRRFLQQKLPEYMLPAAFVSLEAWPLLPNGKVNRRALPLPDGTRPELGEPFVAPRTPVEETLASIWIQLLDVNQVGIYDNFFELGGHSLLATQVVSHVQDIFGVKLSLRTLFENPTIVAIASAIPQDGDRQMDDGLYIKKADDNEYAAQMLARLDELEESEMDALLNKMLAGEENLL